MIFNKDFNELLSVFNDHKVKYLIVGGYAVGFHAQPRATKDLDILIKPDVENGKALYSALAAFGAPMSTLTADDLTEPGAFFRMGVAPVMVEIFPGIQGIDFEMAWERRVEVPIDDGSGQTAYLLSESDLLASKIAAGRPQDLADIEAIRSRARAERPPEKPVKPAAHPTLKTIDDYIATQQPEVRTILETIRATIRKAAPQADETISYKMPAFTQNGILVYFAAFKKHIGLYPPVSGDAKIEKAIAPYAGEKGNLRFPLDQPIPYPLIERIVSLRVKQNSSKAARKRRP